MRKNRNFTIIPKFEEKKSFFVPTGPNLLITGACEELIHRGETVTNRCDRWWVCLLTSLKKHTYDVFNL